MPTTIVDPRVDPAWDELVSDSPQATPYHTSAWARSLATCYGYEPRYLVSGDPGRPPAAGLPLFRVRSILTGNRLVSLPFSDICPPLARNDSDRDELLVAARDLASETRASYVEVRGLVSEAQACACGFVPVDHSVNHHLVLQGSSAELMAGMTRDTRENVRRSVRDGIQVEEDTSVAGVRRFYALHLRTRQRLGALPQPIRWFDTLLREFGDGALKILIATHDHMDIGGTVLLAYGDTVYYKYSAADRLPALRPAHGLLWHAICWALEQGYARFDFGRTDPRNAGLVRFKASWGAEQTSMIYGYYPSVRGLSAAGTGGSRAQLAGRLIERLPVSVIQLLGTLAYRHLA